MLETAFWAAGLAAGIRLGVPVLLAAMGELVAQRSGVLNVGLEGMMAAGGLAALVVTAGTDSYLLGAAAGVVAGAAVASVMVVAAVYGGADQIVAGFAVLVMAAGIVDFLNAHHTFASVLVPPVIAVPGLHGIPVVGVLFAQNAYYYAAVAVTTAVAFVVFRTRFGLEASAVGQNPDVARAKGINVEATRALATLTAGALAGLGGAALVVGALGNYTPGITAGRGFVAIAVVIVGRWSPGWALLAALLFGLADGLQLSLANFVDVPPQALAVLPWATVVVMLALSARSVVMPRALGRRLQVEAAH